MFDRNRIEVQGAIRVSEHGTDLEFNPETEKMLEDWVDRAAEHAGKAFKFIIEIVEHL